MRNIRTTFSGRVRPTRRHGWAPLLLALPRSGSPSKAVLIFLISVFLSFSAMPASAASDPSLYFDSATFDYYLEKTDTGTKMKVKETLNAVFSSASTSHGPTRIIPFTNQAGENVTIDDLKITATRNGTHEPIAKIEKDNGYFRVNIGSSSTTVQGEQIYVLEYEFKNVITEYDASGQDTSGYGGDHQELYWDTNGTGWPNTFNSITANVHFANNYPVKEPAFCYTGSQGSSGRDCTVARTSDGFTFQTTRRLQPYENMTFDIEFPAGTFSVPISRNYILVISTVIISVCAALAICFEIKKYRKYAKEKSAYAKNLLTAPQYIPMDNLTVAEAGLIYTGESKPTQTATLLELAIAHKIQLISKTTTSSILGREKTTWAVKMLESANLTEPQKIILKILNGGELPNDGDEIEIKKQTATSTLAELAKRYSKKTRELLQTKKLLELNVKADSGRLKSTRDSMLVTVFKVIMFILAIVLTFLKVDDSSFVTYGNVIGKDFLLIVIWVVVIISAIITTAIDRSVIKYSSRTKAGLDASNYLEGLKLYISLAEKERLEFNQSAKNAPKDEKGLVKLYERILPYACLFGLEESWFLELQKYYEALDYSPDWYYGHNALTYSTFNSMMATTATTITNNSAWHDSSSSSGVSGGGGGGFSGGGGGGGGGGSW